MRPLKLCWCYFSERHCARTRSYTILHTQCADNNWRVRILFDLRRNSSFICQPILNLKSSDPNSYFKSSGIEESVLKFSQILIEPNYNWKMDRQTFLVVIIAIFVIYVNCNGELVSGIVSDRNAKIISLDFSPWIVVPPTAIPDDVSEEVVKYHEQEKCGFNRRFTSCGNLCNTTCKTMGPFCAEECTVGCLCNEGYGVFSILDICVPIVSPLCKFERQRYWAKLQTNAIILNIVIIYLKIQINEPDSRQWTLLRFYCDSFSSNHYLVFSSYLLIVFNLFISEKKKII